MTGPTDYLPSHGSWPGANDQTVEIPRIRSGPWRELSAALAAGLCVLAVVVFGLQVLGWVNRVPGPGLTAVTGHAIAAIAALLAHRMATHTQGRKTAAWVTVVIAITAAVTWFFWWA